MAIEITLTNAVAAAGAQTVNKSTGGGEESGFSDALKKSTAQSTDLDLIFEEASRTYNVPVSLLKAVAKAESSFRPDATSRSGAMGIMQLMPGTAKSLGVTDAYDPEQNIMGGAKYLSQQLDRFDGDVSLALAAYNAGPGAVTKYGGIPPYNETQNYVKKVMGYMGEEAITAGAVTTKSEPEAQTSKTNKTGSVRDTGISSSNDSELRDIMIEMFMMKMMELERKSSEDERKVF